ncbi:hypothetical protein BY996DRAFT_6421056 [Phakopsora pachyrhizi]|nr:hypothetical protein BY996DRAFT_6421056 [Phakopsora pachyrhizi]
MHHEKNGHTCQASAAALTQLRHSCNAAWLHDLWFHDKSQDLKWNSGFYFLPVVTVLSPTVSYLHLTQKEEPSVVINGEVTMMPDIDEVFKSIEAFEMKMEWLTSSKLGKVLKQVGALDNSKVPLDEKYNIRARA